MNDPAIAKPRGPFKLRICAGCGEQLNDGHHAHDGRLSPTYEVPAVLAAQQSKDSAIVVSTYPDGTTETQECAVGDYVIVLGPDRYLGHVQTYPVKGTTVLTIKTRRQT
jgi:hypothetical protein